MAGPRRAINSGAVRTVRIGGFALVACLIVFVAGPVFNVLATIRVPLGTWGPAITQFLYLTLFFVGLWATRVYFRALGHRWSAVFLVVLIVGMAINLAVRIWYLADRSQSIDFLARNMYALAALTSVPVLVSYLALIVIGVREIQFRREGGGLWMVIGALHIVLGCLIISQHSILLLMRLLPRAGIGMLVVPMLWLPSIGFFLVFPSVLICHAIGLFKGVKKVAALNQIGAVFD